MKEHEENNDKLHLELAMKFIKDNQRNEIPVIVKLINYYNKARLLLIILNQFTLKYDKLSQLFELLKKVSNNQLNLNS